MSEIRKAFIATPAYGNRVLLPHMLSVMELQEALRQVGIPFEYMTLGNESHVIRARNVCAASFLQTDATDLFFIDADIEFTVEDWRKIWNLDAPIAVGVYQMKKPGAGYAAWVGGELVTDPEKLVEPMVVDRAGTGFMRIRRDVLEAMIEFDLAPYHKEGEEAFDCWRFFHSDVVYDVGPDPVYLPEDYWFCRTAIQIDFEVWMDPTVRLIHWGDFGYGS